MALGLMLTVSGCVLYKVPLRHLRPSLILLMLGMLLLILGLAVVFSHILPYRLSVWLLMPSGVVMAVAALALVAGLYKRGKEKKWNVDPPMEEETKVWPPPPRYLPK